MRRDVSVRMFGVVLAMTGMVAASAAAQPIAFDTFDGGGYGRTEDAAILAAMDDAMSTASAFGYYDCEMMGEPEVFRSSHPTRKFNAQVRMRCR